MVPYRQGRTAAEDAFKLSSNENPYPPLPAVMIAISDASVNRYPEGSAAALRNRLGQRFGISAERVQVGAGSVAVLSQLISASSAPGDEVIFSWRSFEAYPLLVAASGATAVQVANTPDHRHDLDALAAAITERTRLVIVCSPNNPTSTIVTRDEFVAFMARVPESVLVVLDEAYTEFIIDESAVNGADLLDVYSNLVVLRTFSKAYGLAGLRIGYALGQEYVMDAARAVAIPLSVTDAAQRAAVVSLDNEAELLERVTALNAVREEIYTGLVAQGWQVPRPHGNFVWLPTADDTARAAEIFAANDIVTRPLVDGLRVSVGETESVEKLLKAAAEVVSLRQEAPPAPTLD